MKKLTNAVAAVVAAAAVAGCGNGTPKANMTSDVDTLSYAMGMTQSQGLKQYLVERMEVDTAYMDEFIKGLNEGANAGDDKKQTAHAAGYQIGQQISNLMVKSINREVFGEDSTKTISLKNFLAGFISGATGKQGLMTADQAQVTAQNMMQAIKKKEMEKQFGENKRAGEKFLADYAKQEGVKQLPGGVLYKVIKEGTGDIPKDTSVVRVDYEGRTIDGTVFDTTKRKDGEPLTLRANQVITGWTEALTRMPVGSVWEVAIPQDKAYGSRQEGSIKPLSALIFKIELLGIGQ